MLTKEDFKLNDNQTYTTKYEEHILLYAQFEGVKFDIMRLLTPEDDFTRSWQLNINDTDHGSHSSIQNAIDICNRYIKDHKLDISPVVVVQVVGGIVQGIRSNRKDITARVYDFDNNMDIEMGEEMEREMKTYCGEMYQIW